MLGKEEILFKGAKPFSSTGNTMGVTLVLHTALDVIEVISYEPTFDKEAPRIYLKNSAVRAVLDQEEIGRKLEEADSRRQVRDKAQLLADAVISSTVEYILDCLCIVELDSEQRSVRMEIKSTPDGVGANSIICAKPKRLRMFKSPHYHTLLDGLAEQMLEPARDYRMPGLKMLRRTDYVSSNQDRWRIPIIFVKVQNGRILTPADARVWCAVTRAIDPEVVALAVAKALNVKLADRPEEVKRVKSFAGKSGMSLGANLSSINTNLTPIYTAYNSKDNRTPSTASATPKSRHHPGRSSFSDTSGVSGNSSPNISPTKRAQLNRAPTGMSRSPFARVNTASSSSSLLAGITASMKKRFSMGLTYNEDEDGEPNKATTSPTPQKLRGKPKTVALKKTKTARGDAGALSADEAEETKDEPEPEGGFESSSISQRISAGFSAFSTSLKRTLSFKPKQAAAASQVAMQLHEGEEDSDEDVGFEKEGAMHAANDNEAVTERNNAVPTRKLSVQYPSPKSVTTVPSERKKVNYAVASDSNKPSALSSKPSLSPKTKKASSPAPKVHSRIASMRSGAMLDTARSTTSDVETLQSGSGSAPVTPVSAPPQSAEEFRDAMLKKQSTKTASAIRTMNSRSSFRANTYGLEDTDPNTSSSPMAQFFAKMTPTWTNASSRVLPTESVEVEAM